MKCVFIAGMPATGKSTLAAQMGKSLGLPVLEKDEIKECLFDTVGFTCYVEKRRLDVAATEILLSLLVCLRKADVSVIVVNNFSREAGQRLNEFLRRDGVEAVTVFLTGDPQVLYERYYDRDRRGLRHAGHVARGIRRTFPAVRDGSGFLGRSRDQAGHDLPRKTGYRCSHSAGG